MGRQDRLYALLWYSESMKILVTGAAGFIGFHVAKRLLERGDTVVGIDVVNDYYDPALKEARIALLQEEATRIGAQFDFLRANLADRRAVEAFFDKHLKPAARP